MRHRWPDAADPIRANLELTVRLRNRIEHRYEAGLTVVSAGFCQSLVINYEEELIAQFGEAYSVADLVHIPVSLSTFSREGVARLVAAQASLPRRLKDFFITYRDSVAPDIREDKRFEFRVELIQKRAPVSEADLAVSFVRESDLDEEERKAYQQLERVGRVIIREKERPVANLGRLRPKPFCSAVEARIPYRFRASSDFPQAWKNLSVRPSASARGQARRVTDERYCIYDDAHDDYVYLPAFLELLVKRCSTREGFVSVVGREPVLKGAGDKIGGGPA